MKVIKRRDLEYKLKQIFNTSLNKNLKQEEEQSVIHNNSLTEWELKSIRLIKNLQA